MQKQKLTEKLHRWARLTVAMIAVGTMEVHDGWAQVVDDDYVLEQNPFEFGEGLNQYKHIGFVTDVAMASDQDALEANGFHVMRKVDWEKKMTVKDVDNENDPVGTVKNQDKDKVYFGYKTSQESTSKKIYGFFHKSLILSGPSGYSKVPGLGGVTNKFMVDNPATFHFDYEAELGVIKRYRKDTKGHKAMASPVGIPNFWGSSGDTHYPTSCHLADDDPEEQLWDGPFIAQERDFWDLDFCNSTSKPTELDTNLPINNAESYASFFKYVPNFDGYYTPKSSVAIVMHYWDPEAKKMISQNIFQKDFEKEEDTEMGEWNEDSAPVDLEGTPVGRVQVRHGMRTMAKHQEETMANWDEWRIYFLDGGQKYVDNLSFTMYVVHDYVLQYRTFTLHIDDNTNYTQVAPFINIDATSDQIGSIIKTLVMNTEVKKKSLRFKATDEYLYDEVTSSDGTLVTFVLPARNEATEYVATLWAYASRNDQQLVQYDVTFTAPAFHTIDDLTAHVDYNLDKYGIMQPTNVIRWSVRNPKDEDILPNDQFLLFRADNPDFENEVCLEQFPFRSDGIYEYQDKVTDDLYNEPTESNDTKLYYRVTRAIVYGNWNGNEGNYPKSASLEQSLTLPSVTDVKVTKSEDFDTSHKVKVRIELDNPWNNPAINYELSEGTDYVLHNTTHRSLLAYNDSGEEAKAVLQRENDYIYSMTYMGKDSHGGYKFEDHFHRHLQAKAKSGYYLLDIGTEDESGSFTFSEDNIGVYIRYVIQGGYASVYKQDDTPYVEISGNRSGDRWSLHEAASLHRSYRWDKNAQIVVKRTGAISGNELDPDCEKDFVIPGNKIAWDSDKLCYYAEINDIQTFGYTYYYYQASVDPGSSRYQRSDNKPYKSSVKDARDCYTTTMATVTDLTATHGETMRADGICLEWQADENTISSYEILRREHGESIWNSLATISGNEHHYLDTDCEIGEVYDYRLTSKLTFRNDIYTNDYEVTGARGYYGSVSGTITMPNGQRMPGKLEVTLQYTQDIDYKYVEGYRDAASVNAKTQKVLTTTDGSFLFQNVLLDRNITKCNVTVRFSEDGNLNFENPAGDGNTFVVTMNRDLTEYTGCNYVCKDTYRYSGRVLYQGTTIPVRDVQFTFNDNIIMGANGEPVVTDQKGNFSFDVPRAQATVAASMQGHTLLNEGKIKNKEGQFTFTPTSDLEELQLWDQTTVRLVGRMVGGNKQGQLPLGFGASTNNLGDDLKLVLELEGDDTALLVYDEKNPDVISRDSMEYEQTVTLANKNTEVVDKTVANFKKHRIEIYPNIETGEFCIDLYPTKYKITELSARGYATLYNQGEGMEILDLTHAADELQTVAYSETNKKTTQYNHTYNRIYHSQAYVHFTQYRYGMKQPFYGVEKMMSTNPMGDTDQVTLASCDTETGEVTYTFGYPVFAEGQVFSLEAYAYEKYYYNGEERSARADSCTLDTEATLIVNNGFVSSDNRLTLPLNAEGKALFTFRPTNADFTNTGLNTLRTLSAQVVVNNRYYDADGIRAFVTGTRRKGNDAMSVIADAEGDITIFDIVRDPYGAKSYGWRESGSKYHFEAERDFTLSIAPKLEWSYSTEATAYLGQFIGISANGVTSGAWTGKNSGATTMVSFGVSIPSSGFQAHQKAVYEMTLNEKVSTSAETNMIGARADIYIGSTDTYAVCRNESFCVIDSATYEVLQGAIEGGKIRIVHHGIDTDGKDYYLAIGETYSFEVSEPHQFMYTQQYIVNQLIPELWQQYKSMIYTGSKEDVQQIANESNQIVFRLKDGKSITDADCFEPITPENGAADPRFTPDHFLNSILKWIKVIATNESKKLAAISSADPYASYDVSSNVSVNRSESTWWYDNGWKEGTFLGKNYNSGNWEPEIGIAIDNAINTDKAGEETQNGNDEERNKKTSFTVEAQTFKVSFEWNPGFSISYKYSTDCLSSYTAGTGYYIQTVNDGTLMQDVYRVYPGSWSSLNQDKEDETLKENDKCDGWEFLISDWIKEDTAMAKLKDFVFTVRGGAERSPWYAPDSTLFFFPGTPLTAQTMKIDNPKIYIDQPIVSNLATDEKATYRIRLTNETEMTIPDYSTRNPSSFVLRIKPNTNPNGANVYYNGSPLIEGLSLSLKPGTSMEGVIQLERVGDAYDFDSLVVQFFDQTYTLVSEQAISAHFVPTSSPIKMAQPANKWVMNTLSAKDETGYYIPVKLSDFDTNYANFDHIELQYKKHTEGDDRWVNQCSFFFDEELYDKANGNKELVTGRTIENIKFHGDMDPIEMEYDLRAVTFCRLGTGFVTRTSEVITGTKDTRAPEVFGMPKPTDGILTFEDVISIPFNEPIAYNYLDKTANFQVMGYTNNADQQYNTTATFVSNYSEAISQVTRNLTASDYTIDMMVQLNKSDFPIDLFRLKPENEQSSFVWEYWPEGSSNDPKWNDVFVLWVNNTAFVSQILASQNLSVSNAITHIGLSVNNGEPVFYVEGQTLNVRNVNDPKIKTGVKYDAKAEKISGNVIVGGYMSNGMKMADLRLWNKSLSSDEFVKYKAKHLSPTTPGLIGHWPMDEARGQVLHDEVNGADLTMEGMGWYLPEGEHSLHLDGKPVALESNKCYKFIRRDYEDYTLTFWYRIKELTQQGNVPLFTAGSSHNDGQGIIVAHDGNHLKLLSNGNEFVISKVAADSAWHFVAVVANKSHNTVSLFHDNNLTEALSGNEVSGIANAFVQLGGNGFVGNLDCLTFWHVALTPNTIMQTYTTEPSGHEMELQYYLPFETNDRNDQNTIISEFSPCNQVYKLDREGNRLAPDTLFVATGTMADRNTFCPLRTLTGLENLPFNWTSTLNELQINIKKADNAINHQQLFVTVRNVEDLAGNTLANAEMLSLYVDRNVLTWDKREYIDTIRYGESTEFALQWTNACGKRLAYSIQNYNSWLTADVEMGEADPAGYGTVKFRVDQGLAPGEYTAFVYLVDENKLASPMYIKIIVKTEAPDWQLVDQQEYAFSMNLIGKVILSSEQTGSADDAIDQDTRDIVAAFYDGKCVGKTNINSKSKYNLFMTIYGNNAMLPKSSGKNKTDGAAIEFRLWRASTGHIEILESHDPNATDKAKDAVRFADQKVAGSTQNPVILRVTEQSIQQLNLKKGWNWISFNVEPTDVSSANKLFLDNEPFSQDDVLKFNDEFFSMYVDGIGWDNTSTDNSAHMNVAIGRTYKLYMHQAGTAYVQGSQISDEKRVITLQPGQWNNMAYLLRVDQPINTAMSSYLASKENEGSIIKSIDQFAVASVDGNETKWEGSLEYLHPGQGYYIYHAGKQEAKIYFSNDDVAAQSAPTRGSLEAETALQHSTSMPIVAAFAPQVEAEPTDQVYAYVGDELVGHASLIDCGGMGRRYFLSVNAEQGDQVTFAQVRDNEVIALCDATLSYDADQVVGTLDQPMLLNTTGHMVSVTPNVFTQYVDFTICTPGIDRLGSAIQICVYNAAGALVWEREVLASTSGLTRQRMDGSWLTPGVYVAKVMAGGRTESVRLIRK